ncbi:MAG: hypothetical protein Phog2KO_33930 [Phototrophicaceae bacterium]
MLKSRLKSFFTDQRSAMLIRWWAAGAVYFFIGWGTSAGQSMIELVFSLGLVMALLNILIINPSLRLLFNIGNKRPQHENTFLQRLSDRLVEFIKTIFIVFIVAIIYELINRAIIALLNLPSDNVPLPGEPIMFGIFYVFVFWCLGVLGNKIKALVVNNRKTESKA